MRCAECGAKTAKAAQFCARCAAPVPSPPPVAAGPAVGGPGDSVAGGYGKRKKYAATHAAGPPSRSGTDPVNLSSRARLKQQSPRPAPDPEAGGAILAEWIESRQFSTTWLRPGYDLEQVDAFLAAIHVTFLGIREPPLTADEVRDKKFSTTRLRPGYDEKDVDAFLEEVEARLPIRCAECGAPTVEPVQFCVRCRAPASGQRPWPHHPVMMPGGVTASQRLQRLPKGEKRVMRAAMIFLCLIGVLLGGIGLGVFLTQGSQVRVRANVLSKRCHPQTDLASGERETRCDAQVQFTTVNGHVIQTTITDAFPDEFSRTGRSWSIALRYNRGDPTQPYKQSNYMPTGTFVMLLIFGAATISYGGWMLYKLRPPDASQRNHAQPSDLVPS